MEDATGQQPSPSKKPRTSSDPDAAPSERERGSMEPESFKDLGGDSDEFKNLPKIKHEEAEELLKKQGIWGEQKTSIDPEDIDRARRAISAPTASKASDVNDGFVETSKKEAEHGGLRKLPELQDFLDNRPQIERTSPTFALANQKHGPNSGFCHDDGRKDPMYWFKLQHMSFRSPNVSFEHPTQKYCTTERRLRDCMKKLDPVYEHRLAKGKIIFDAGDVRSTIDDDLLEKSSKCAQRAASLKSELLGMLGDVQGTRSNLQNALLHYFLSCGISKEEIGELVLDDAAAQRAQETHDRDRTDGHIYTSKTSLGFLTVNLGNFARGHKNTMPAVYQEFFTTLDDAGVGPMLQSLAHSRSHLILLSEASELTDSEVAYLGDNGWLVHQNNAKDLAVATSLVHTSTRLRVPTTRCRPISSCPCFT